MKEGGTTLTDCLYRVDQVYGLAALYPAGVRLWPDVTRRDPLGSCRIPTVGVSSSILTPEFFFFLGVACLPARFTTLEFHREEG